MSGRALLGLLGLVGAGCDDLDPLASQPRAEAFGASTFFEDGRAMRPLVTGTVAQEWLALRREGPARRQGLEADGGWVQAVPEPLTLGLLEEGRGAYDTWCAVCHGLTGDGDSAVARKMPQRRPPGLFVPHDHATQVVYGVEEGAAPYTGTRAVASHMGPRPFPLPREVGGWGAVRDTHGPDETSPPEAPADDGGATDRGAAVERARRLALVGPPGGPMEGLLDMSSTGDLPHPPGFYFAVISDGFGLMPAYGAQLPPHERWAIVAYLRALGRSQRAPLASAPADVRARLGQEVRAP
ncbi:cytochrome c [Corallococcus sp. bb12-1]|uniref:c-type cytochrome n=1 Tax=Corallococcus sp. bb12-1 TaxID=2996784 RepID=UPI0022716DFA|nr:cytochrome c [Corallococcus sp. bb12-1]MCY1046943.1 cytochrome c [Corallococcus sp. bb12-1]